MPKKGINIFKRKDGRWEARYVKSIGMDGKKKYGSVYGRSFSEAKEKQDVCLNNLKFNSKGNKNCILLDLMHEWLAKTKVSIKKTTYQKYEGIIRNHIEPHSISRTQVKYISSKIISDYTNDIVSGDKLSIKTINDILIVIGLSLSYAEDIYNFPKPKIKYLKESRKEMRVLSINEQKLLERYLYSNLCNYKIAILLALYTGIRIGELCALQWDDIKEDNIVINKSMHRIKDGDSTVLEITEPKTYSSNRIIPIPSFLKPLLLEFRSTGYFIVNRNGKPVEPRLMQLTFERYIERCGLPKTNFHALRHTFATRCVESGFDIKSLSEILGHTDVKTTLNKYVHSSYEQKQKNMELLNPVINL